MGFYNDIQKGYGEEIAGFLKKWSSLKKKMNNLLNNKIFLLQCRDKEIIPNHLRIKRGYLIRNYDSYKATYKALSCGIRMERTLLNLEIINIHNKLKHTSHTIKYIEYMMVERLPATITNRFFEL